ncbi:MAG: phage/plasmid primase, P4 family [Candidatus Bathyarchaeia archaeon]
MKNGKNKLKNIRREKGNEGAADTLTILFNIEELRQLKNKHPDWVIVAGDKDKNPEGLGKGWKAKTQTMAEFESLINYCRDSTVEYWNFGMVTGLGNVNTIDFDWEFVYHLWVQRFGPRTNTLTFRTPNLGYRVLFCSTEKDNSNPYKKPLHTEFLNNGYAALGGYAIDTEGHKGQYVLVKNTVILEDNSLGADTRKFLAEILEKYDFLQYQCVFQTVNSKHILLEHNQRLALLAFMLSKGFNDAEIHNFFKTVYDSKGRDYQYSVTQAQIESGKDFKNRGGKPHPCVPKAQEDGRKSIALYEVFVCDPKTVCSRCKRHSVQAQKTANQEAKEAKMAAILDDLNSRYTFKTPTDLEDLHFYEDGIYKKAKHKLEKELEDNLGPKVYTYYIEEVLRHLERQSYVSREEFNKFTGVIPVQNGLLDLETQTLKPFNKEQIFTYKLNVTYDDTKKCPIWLKFLEEILPDPADRTLLQEIMGYTLFPGMPKHKIFWFYGIGRNGKGRVIATLEFIFGSEFCANIELKEFDGEHRFAVAQLYGCLINVSSEPDTKNALETALIKKLTGEDTLDAEVKIKQRRLKFKNMAKPFVLGNNFPPVKDTSLGFWDRVEILKFPNSFIGENQKDDIEKTWLCDPNEVSGILNWMLEGLHRISRNKDFSKSKTTAETMTEFKRASDPIGAWLDDNCVFGLDFYISRKASHDNYKLYCEDMNATPETDRKFYERLRNTPRVRDSNTKIKGETETRFWIGLCLKTDVERQKTLLEAKSKVKQTELGTDSTDSTGNGTSGKQNTEENISLREGEKSVENVESVANSRKANQSAIGESNVEYVQKNYTLKIKPISHGKIEKCWNCEGLESAWEIQLFLNGVLQGVSYNCNSCLKEHTIPDYKAQGAKFDVQSPEPTDREEAS